MAVIDKDPLSFPALARNKKRLQNFAAVLGILLWLFH